MYTLYLTSKGIKYIYSKKLKQSCEVNVGSGEFADVTFASDGGSTGERKAKRPRRELHQHLGVKVFKHFKQIDKGEQRAEKKELKLIQ